LKSRSSGGGFAPPLNGSIVVPSEGVAVRARKTGYDWSGWTTWRPLVDVEQFPVPVGPGAYVVATRSSLTRAVGADPEGFLTIGESDNLRTRVRSFLRCARDRSERGHMAGWRYAFFHFAKHFPLQSLSVRWQETKTKDEAYEREGLLMLTYLHRHSELPPLNYKFNWSPFERQGWDLLDRFATPPRK
jgi:hypothetical protein